jgi:hypothetical protein
MVSQVFARARLQEPIHDRTVFFADFLPPKLP